MTATALLIRLAFAHGNEQSAATTRRVTEKTQNTQTSPYITIVEANTRCSKIRTWCQSPRMDKSQPCCRKSSQLSKPAAT